MDQGTGHEVLFIRMWRVVLVKAMVNTDKTRLVLVRYVLQFVCSGWAHLEVEEG